MKRGKLLLIVTTVIFFPRSVVIHWTKWKHVLTLKKGAHPGSTARNFPLKFRTPESSCCLKANAVVSLV